MGGGGVGCTPCSRVTAGGGAVTPSDVAGGTLALCTLGIPQATARLLHHHTRHVAHGGTVLPPQDGEGDGGGSKRHGAACRQRQHATVVGHGNVGDQG